MGEVSGLRFRQSVKVGPFRINLGKKSVSVTAKVGPVKRTIGTRGTRTSVNLPGPFSWTHRRPRRR